MRSWTEYVSTLTLHLFYSMFTLSVPNFTIQTIQFIVQNSVYYDYINNIVYSENSVLGDYVVTINVLSTHSFQYYSFCVFL